MSFGLSYSDVLKVLYHCDECVKYRISKSILFSTNSNNGESYSLSFPHALGPPTDASSLWHIFSLSGNSGATVVHDRNILDLSYASSEASTTRQSGAVCSGSQSLSASELLLTEDKPVEKDIFGECSQVVIA